MLYTGGSPFRFNWAPRILCRMKEFAKNMPQLSHFKGRRERQLVVVVALVVGLVYLLSNHYYTALSPWRTSPPWRGLRREEYTVWPPFIGRPPRSTDWYIDHCFDRMTARNVEEIFASLIPTWAESIYPECQEVYRLFHELYEVRLHHSQPLFMSQQFAKKVKGWMGGNETFREKVDRQTVIHIFHPLVAEHVVYNPVRAQRPMPSPDQDIFEWVDDRAEQTQQSCDFCRYKTHTAVDRFRRHKTKDTVRVTNTFKMDVHHSMIIPTNTHHPLHLPLPLLTHMFEEAKQWFFDVSTHEPSYIYPNLAWDTLFKAGASQVHPHIHMILAPDHYQGPMEGMRAAAQKYFSATGRNYFSSLVSIHTVLGLAVQYGDAVALANLAGKGDLEVMILCDIPSKDFLSLIYFAVQAFHETFRQPCKSMGSAWPAMGMSYNASLGRLPAIARLVSRGDCTSLKADVSSFEIFEAVFKPHTPWHLAAAIRLAIDKYDEEQNKTYVKLAE